MSIRMFRNEMNHGSANLTKLYTYVMSAETLNPSTVDPRYAGVKPIKDFCSTLCNCISLKVSRLTLHALVDLLTTTTDVSAGVAL